MKGDYERYTNRAITLIHSPETSDAVLQTLQGPDPVQKVADGVVMVMQRIDAAARDKGVEVQDSVKIFGAHEIVNLVVELGEAAGVLKLEDDLRELALSVAVQDYVKGEVAARRIDPKKLQVAVDADIRKMPPKDRKEIQASQLRIQQTARKYNGGQGIQGPAEEPTAQKGLIASAGGM